MKLPSVPRLGPTVWGIAAFLLVLAIAAPLAPTYVLTVLVGLLVFATLAYSLAARVIRSRSRPRSEQNRKCGVENMTEV